MSIKYGSIDDRTIDATAQLILAPPKRGRPRGAKNAFRNAKSAEICAELKIDPLRELLKICKRRKLPIELKIQALAHCLKFCHPALSTAHVTSQNETRVTTQKQLSLVLQRKPELVDALDKLAIELAIAGDVPAIDVKDTLELPPADPTAGPGEP